jgi:indole-3-glycerol phosphate synthase
VSLLERILTQKKSELGGLRGRRLPPPPPRRPLGLSREPGQPLRIISEIKRRSPSAGALNTTLSVGARARAYERGGASMVSVLCDSAFFDGGFEHLAEARDACALPLLCKEFVIDEVQLDAARAYGADAVLLIVRCLAPERVSALHRAAVERELVPFVEIANEDEARIASDAGATLVGVNARDLDTLAMDAARVERILLGLAPGATRVHLSGLRSPDDVALVAAGGADAALIGEALMRLDDPVPLLAAMVARAG